MSDAAEEPPTRFQIALPPEMEPGVYADFVSVWHTPTSFVLDFAALVQPPNLQQDEQGQPLIVVPSRVTARVRIPPEQVFELAKALTSQLDQWEQETGRKPPFEGIPGLVD